MESSEFATEERDVALMKWARIVVGSIFLAAGLLKLGHGDFESAVRHYDIVPALAVPWVAHTLPFLEVIVGLGMLTGYALRGASLWAELLLYSFGLGQVSVLLRGLDIDCGCFGELVIPVTWTHAMVCLLLGAGLTRLRLAPTVAESG